MVTLLNFSHPLTGAEIKALRAEYGVTTVYDVPVQLDVEMPITPQLAALMRQALDFPGVDGNPYNVDCIIPPGFSVAAGYMARRFPSANLVVRLRRGMPPQFMPTELVRR